MLAFYERLLRPWLFRCPPEVAHDLALFGARTLAHWPALARGLAAWQPVPGRPLQRLGLTFPHPFGLAGGLDKNGLAPLAWWAFGLGFLELGTVTPVGQPGNPKPRLFRFPTEAALVNRMGFNNFGATALANRLRIQRQRGLRPPIPLGVSVGKNKVTPLSAAAEDFSRAAAAVAPEADFLTINVSSPNTPDLRDLQNEADLARIVAAVRQVAQGKPVLVKFAPEVDAEALVGLVAAARSAGAVGFIATNTRSTKGQPEYPEGGLSGEPLRQLALARIESLRRLLPDEVCLIGCGGIQSAEHARDCLRAGADLIQAYTGFVYHGPGLPRRLSSAWAPHSGSAAG